MKNVSTDSLLPLGTIGIIGTIGTTPTTPDEHQSAENAKNARRENTRKEFANFSHRNTRPTGDSQFVLGLFADKSGIWISTFLAHRKHNIHIGQSFSVEFGLKLLDL